MPAWVLNGVGKLGFPIIVSLLLLGMLTGWVPGLVTAKDMDRHTAQSEEMVHLLRIICINTGQGREAVSICLKRKEGE